MCILERRLSGNNKRIFPELSYTDGLAYVKFAAMALKLLRAEEWGTHAFRRGRGNQALKDGGVSALFQVGSWRSVAAFGYASARARAGMTVLEHAVEHSDSDGEEG